MKKKLSLSELSKNSLKEKETRRIYGRGSYETEATAKPCNGPCVGYCSLMCICTSNADLKTNENEFMSYSGGYMQDYSNNLQLAAAQAAAVLNPVVV
jgi:hypothetical protein